MKYVRFRISIVVFQLLRTTFLNILILNLDRNETNIDIDSTRHRFMTILYNFSAGEIISTAKSLNGK